MSRNFLLGIALSGFILPALASASPTPMRLLESYPRIDVINVGANEISEKPINGGGRGALSVSGLSGSVIKAWLYWKGIEFIHPPSGFTEPGNGTYDESEIRFDEVLINGTLVADQGSVDCHPTGPVPDSGALYRADVTTFVQARGNGSYAFSGLSDGLESDPADAGAHSANGISLIIYFDDGNSANDRRLDHYEGQLSSTEGEWNFEFPVDYIGGAVDLILHVSDGQSIFSDGAVRFNTSPGRTPGVADILRFNGSFSDGLAKYAGLSVPSMGAGRLQGLWDIRRTSITPQFGRYTHYINELFQEASVDCVSLQVAQVLSAPAPDVSMLMPVTHDFGDTLLATQSASQIFTVTNLWPYPIEFPSAPTTTAGTWFRVLAQNCTGQALAPGGVCSMEVACTPPNENGLASVAPPAILKVAWRPVPQSTNGTLYSKLVCGGVPNSPFSRLQFEPSGCFLDGTPVNTVSTLQALVVRNTGSLPSTIASTVIQHTQGAGFSLLSTTCTAGRTLAPTDSCEIRLQYQAASVPTTTRAVVSVNYIASDSVSQRFTSMEVEGRSVAANPDSGDTLFKNGFESTEAQCLE